MNLSFINPIMKEKSLIPLSPRHDPEPGKSGWVSSRNNYYLIRVQDREKADTPGEETLKDLTARLKREKGSFVFQEWVENLKESYEILIDKTQL